MDEFDRPTLRTERLLLRKPDLSDRDAIVSIAGDWDIARNLSPVPHPYTKEDADFFLEKVVPAQWVWAITLGESEPLIGCIGLAPTEIENVADLGYWLARDHWGKGYGAESVRAVLKIAFDEFGISTVTAGPFAENIASIKVLKKAGFRFVGKGVRNSLSLGATQISAEFEMSRDGFSAAP